MEVGGYILREREKYTKDISWIIYKCRVIFNSRLLTHTAPFPIGYSARSRPHPSAIIVAISTMELRLNYLKRDRCFMLPLRLIANNRGPRWNIPKKSPAAWLGLCTIESLKKLAFNEQFLHLKGDAFEAHRANPCRNCPLIRYYDRLNWNRLAVAWPDDGKRKPTG